MQIKWFMNNINLKLTIWTLFISLVYIVQPSAEVSVTHYKNQATVAANSCVELSKEIKALKKLSNNKDLENESIFQINTDGLCTTKGNRLLPSLLAKLNNQAALIDGPNCWNFALHSTGSVTSIRYTEPYEVNTLLNSPLCQAIPEDKAKPGDLAFVKDFSGQHIHAYIYITPNLLYAKHAQAAMYHFKLMTTKEMLKSYGRTRECRMKGLHHKECYNHTVYYRCHSFASYTKKINLTKKASSVAKLFDLLDTIEKALEPLVIDPQYRMRNLPKKNVEESDLYKKIAKRLIELTKLSDSLAQFSSYDTFYRSKLTKPEQYFFEQNANQRIQSVINSSHELVKRTSLRRKMDKTLFKNFKASLKKFLKNNSWSGSVIGP